MVHEMVRECSKYCKEFDNLKKREKRTEVTCIMPSGEIFDANGVSAVELESKHEVYK
jgi:hypothetical protein